MLITVETVKDAAGKTVGIALGLFIVYAAFNHYQHGTVISSDEPEGELIQPAPLASNLFGSAP